ncbi:MAG: hypothetical protein WD646_08550 [Actinomycetota bacterium]
MSAEQSPRLARREFFAWAGKRGAVLGLAATSMPAFLAACTRASDDEPALATSPTPGGDEIRAIVGDVIDFELTSDEWQGAFGFVTFRLHQAVVGGKDVYYIRTDTSDQEFAGAEELVWVPKLGGLLPAEATGAWYSITGGVDGQATVLSSEPGRDDYTPAWRINRARWTGSPRELRSVEDVTAAERAGDLTVTETQIVVNAPVVQWSDGSLPVDDTERTEYLGPGQLLEAPDTDDMRVTFKLHECFPGVRYFVADVSLQPMAEGMRIGHSSKLAEATDAKATGRTNVFMNGIKGSGPMGFQPSVFDSAAGSAQWSPYWDHMTYAWKDESDARVLRTEREVHAARDDGELDEFPGTPDTNRQVFVVNCPVPVLAPNTFEG